jgi:hypothetical protein
MCVSGMFIAMLSNGLRCLLMGGCGFATRAGSCPGVEEARERADPHQPAITYYRMLFISLTELYLPGGFF